MAPVKGKVTLDGQPLTKGNVSTVPDAGRGSHGDIQTDGVFELHTFSKNDGALVGKHKVAVAAYDATAGKSPESEHGKLLVPKRYTNYETSGLSIDVKTDEPNTPTIELTSQ
jgi:predicted RecA/RadA family phage recombinase